LPFVAVDDVLTLASAAVQTALQTRFLALQTDVFCFESVVRAFEFDDPFDEQ
jgi:hypothetical protein